MAKAVLESLDEFCKLRPARSQLDAGELARQALSARLYPGARLF